MRAVLTREHPSTASHRTFSPLGGGFEGDGDDRALVVPGGIGADPRLFGKIAGSPLEEGSGYVRVREALRTLALNKWVDTDHTVGELRIRLGERTKLNG